MELRFGLGGDWPLKLGRHLDEEWPNREVGGVKRRTTQKNE
jgi:hypothetical protein